MDKDQLKNLIRRVLKEADLIKYEDERDVELLMLTAAVESNLGYYIKQKGGGPALGIFQMERKTELDHLHYIQLKPLLEYTLFGFTTECNPEYELEYNLAYAIIMTRIHYLRVKEAVPPKNDTEGLAKYWKKYYNTEKGKGTVEKAIRKYNKYVK